MELNNEVLTAQEVADLLKVTKEWVYQKKATGVLPYHKLCGSVRFIKSEILEWVQNQ